ncbi:4-aminobutyrate aminotransferase [Xenorhabdus sp. M]|uniref:4-aminobutyrate aminotransferase n=1 Tax=Xenorhabdus szentirmaii TaxID=290112 RepID=A0AAW3YU03_9GAMM|nr:DUF5682 family protein [Xenorhabdus sp. M]MBD2801056.1 4-aminobutyrate aminotransferase [Xenorhabdus sp. M]
MSISSIPLPERIDDALTKWASLQQQHLYFAPVRHHSPACAYGVLSLIESIKPDYILIEGPDSFNALLPGLLHQDAHPPVAIMAQAEQLTTSSQSEDREKFHQSAYFPFCEYSPEWQALRVGHTHQAKLAFIDLPWAAQLKDEQEKDEQKEEDNTQIQSRSLQRERYLTHSQFITQLAKKCHCRDHDDVWEHLFELRSIDALADWQSLFHDIFIWCALARLDYEPQVLEAEGSSQREAHMLMHITTIKRHNPEAKILTVTGGFHTLALIEGLAEASERQFVPSDDQQKRFDGMAKLRENDSAWLIRYSFDRLDALNGYASGMPSPAFYQTSWQSLLEQRQDRQANHLNANQPTQIYRNKMGVAFLTNIAEAIRKKEFDNPPSYITVKNAAEQSLRLAALRGHAGPGRYDLLDGLQSSFIKGSLNDSQNELWKEITTHFSGFLLGTIPVGTATPPLVAETYGRAKAFRFKLDDTLTKVTKLDVYRNAQHRLRSRFLHLLEFLEIHFAQRINGPDFITGHQLDLLFEEWQYAWTPAVEGELIVLSEKGSQLESIALGKLLKLEKQLEEQGHSRSSQNAVALLIQAVLIGLHQCIPALFRLLDNYIQQDVNLASLTTCGHKLIHLWRGRAFLGIEDHTTLENRLHQVIPQAFFCLDQITQGDEQQQEAHLQALLLLRELVEFMPAISQTQNYLHDFYQQLNRLGNDLDNVPLLKGAADALRYLGDQAEEQLLVDGLNQAFSTGTDPENAINYFVGIMRTAPELVIKTPILVDHLNQLLGEWDDPRFIQILPDLRFAFSQLTPKQNEELSRYIAGEIGLPTHELALLQTEFSAEQMLEATRLNHQLQSRLSEQQLLGWFNANEGSVPVKENIHEPT